MLPNPIDSKSFLPWESKTKIKLVPSIFPGVSIVVPIYNSGQFLEKTIRSILLNDLNGIEIIVMDGGSTDNTVNILNHYEEYITISVSEKDKGQSDAIKKGFQKASKPILYWLNGDDILLPNTLLSVREFFRFNKDKEVVVGDAYMTEIDFTPIRHFQFSPEKLSFEYLIDYASHHLIQPSVFFSRNAWDTCGPVDESLHYAMDADLFLKMSSKYDFAHLPVDIAYSVYHEECKTRCKRAESISELGLVQAKHGGFNYARKTLDILVDLFNDMEVNLQKEKSPAVKEKDGDCQIYKEKLKAIENEMMKNKELLLQLDLDNL